MEKRARRKFTAEYEAEAVQLVLDGDKTIREVSRDLDLTESAVRHWVMQAGIDAGGGPDGRADHGGTGRDCTTTT
jgi:transposase